MKIADYKLKFNVEKVLVYTPEQRQNRIDKQKITPYDKKKSAFCIEYWIAKGFTEKDAKYQISIRRPTNIAYWINKGFNKDEAIAKVKAFTEKGSTLKSMIEIYGDDIGNEKWNDRIEKQRKKSDRCIEFWLERGFDKDEAVMQLKNRQSTRSYLKAIEKFGLEEGIRKTQEMNKKWQDSLNSKSGEEKEDINLRKDSSSLEHLKITYPEDYIERYVQQMLFHYRNGRDSIYEPIRYIVDNISNLGDLIKYVSESFSNIRNVKRIISNKLIVDIFKIGNVEEILNKVYEAMDFKNRECGLYGNRTFFDGHIFLSDIELEIAKFLVDNSIEYEYGKLYPFAHSRHRHSYDFYIKKIDLYVEYAGMKNTEFYDKRLEYKIKKCHEFELNVLASNNILEIKNLILQKIDEINE